MANEEHLAILKQGVDAWNAWRKENPEVKPDLSGAYLSGAKLEGANLYGAKLSGAYLEGAYLEGADLREADLRGAALKEADLREADLREADLGGADLREAKLKGADLSGADLSKAKLSGADLSGADLSGADLSKANLSKTNLGGAKLEEMPFIGSKHLVKIPFIATKTLKIPFVGIKFIGHRPRGIEIGVNGIWSRDTDTAALMTLTPPGNSMLAANPNAVIDSLKHARRLHSLSFGLAVLALGILFLKPEGDIAVPVLEGLKVSPAQFTLLALIVSACVLTLVKSFMGNAHDGARYLHDPQSAMTVGTFSWALSRYTGDQLDKKIQSFLTRLVMAFHPVVYIFL